jgi:carbonic anhydrase
MESLHVRDVIVCGHSECGAMRAIHDGHIPAQALHLGAWLRHGRGAPAASLAPADGLAPWNDLSQRNVLLQIEHLRSYPAVRRAEAAGTLRLHAWWFDIARAEVLDHDPAEGRFVVLDEQRVARLLAARRSTPRR